MSDILFSSVQLGDISLKNRVVMAPMTRSRAGEGDLPSQLHVDYYTQRASAGLIITEGTQPSLNGKGYARTPGIHSPEQTAAWKAVADSVNAAGGAMVMQLMHCGRISSKHNKSADAETVAPSAVTANGEVYSDSHGMVKYDLPRALETDEIMSVVNEYRQATENALQAGFAGVELHATSGYLPAQFLSTGTNLRTDQYGGSAENRVRFVIECLEAMAGVAGPGKVGIRICPGNPFNDLKDDDPEETFTALLKAIESMSLAYLHTIRMPKGPVDNITLSKKYFSGALIVNDSYDAAEASAVLESGVATAVSFGRDFIANPDLVEKMASKSALKKFDASTLYTPGAEGLTDY